MSRMLALLPLLAACVETVVPDKEEEEEIVLAPLGEPYTVIYASTAPDYLRDTCEIGVDLYEVGSDTPVASQSVHARGGEWTGLAITEAVQYTAEATWDECTTVASTGTGSFTSGAFSGAPGDLFLFRYDGVTGAYEVEKQREDFVGGTALVTFVDTATSADVQTLAAEIGVQADLISTEGKQYEITWDDTKAVGAVLAAFSDDNIYLDGEPVWVEVPDWW
ncbi:MAG: hypothetical protein Q8P18_05000 [Pseudomonadota bacterium]|nr:hypothetical protein [Pseudomonadota bacterium]